MGSTEYFNMVLGLFNVLGILTLLQTFVLVMLIVSIALFLLKSLRGN